MSTTAKISRRRRSTGIAVLATLLASAGVGQLTTDDSQYWTQESPGFLESAQDGAQLGSAFAVGDFDADGYDDLAVGAPWYDYVSTPSVPDNGAVFVLRGGPNGLQTSTGHQRLLVLRTRLGAALAAGDFDGNGYDDLAVGAPNATADGVSNAGAVWVLSSGPSGFALPGTFLDAGAYSTPQAGAAFGLELAVGNFNGDTYDDLVIGEPYWDSSGPTLSNRGRVAILAGSATGPVTTSAWSLKAEPFSEVEDDALFGFALAVGDFDANGYDDLAVGAPRADDQSLGSCSLCNLGKIALFWSTGSLLAFDSSFWFTDVVSAPPLADDLFGHTLVAGDFDRDGYADLVVGGPYVDPSVPFPDRGEARVFYGAPGGVDLTNHNFINQNAFAGVPPANDDRFGFALAAGDIDGDGYADLVATSPGGAVGGSARGWAGVVLGKENGLTYAGAAYRFDQDTPGVPDVAENFDELGRAVAVGDFDGDCRSDLVLGVPYEDVLPGQSNEGGFLVIYARELPFRDGFERGTLACWTND